MSATTDIQVWEFPLDWSKVREFANAVHDDHWNEEPLAVPPTLLVMLSAEHLERLILETLHLDRRRAVHGEHEYNFSRLQRVGESIQCRHGSERMGSGRQSAEDANRLPDRVPRCSHGRADRN